MTDEPPLVHAELKLVSQHEGAGGQDFGKGSRWKFTEGTQERNQYDRGVSWSQKLTVGHLFFLRGKRKKNQVRDFVQPCI